PHFVQHLVERAVDFLSARIRHDAEGAVLAAALHDRHEGRRAGGARLRQPVEFLDFREADVDLRAARSPQIVEHGGQAVQGLRSKHQIDEGRARRDALPFLAGDAAAHADHHVRAQLLELPPFPQQGEHFLLCLLAHRTGVDQEQVGLCRIFRSGHAVGGLKHLLHLAGIVLVHLATEGFYVNTAGHGFTILGTMAIREVLKMGDPRLLAVAEPVRAFGTVELNGLLEDMHDTMRHLNGAGLAAPQIGVGLRVVVFGMEHNPRYPEADPVPFTVLINPELTPLGEEMEEGWEGCLSVPGMRGLVPRYRHLRYTGVDAAGEPIERSVSGFHARVVQHEVDHLDGILYPRRIRDLTQFGFNDALFPGQDLVDD